MASFIQPGSYTSAENVSSSAAVSTSSRFLVYTNSIVPSEQFLRYWYQYALLIVGSSLLTIALLRPLFWWILSEYRLWKDKDEPVLADELADFTRRPKEVALQSTKTFGQYVGGDLGSFFERKYDLFMIDLDTYRSRQFLPPQDPSFAAAAGRRRSTVAQIGTDTTRGGPAMITNPHGYTADQMRRLGSVVARPDRKKSMFGSVDVRGSVEIRRGSLFPTAEDNAEGSRRPSMFPFISEESGPVQWRKNSIFPGAGGRRKGSIMPSERRGSTFPGGLTDPARSREGSGAYPTDVSPVSTRVQDPRRGSPAGAVGPGPPVRTVAFTDSFADTRGVGGTTGLPRVELRRGSVRPPTIDSRRTSLAPSLPMYDFRRGSLLAGGPMDMRKTSVAAGPASDFRRGSLLAGGPMDTRKASVAAGPVSEPRRGSILAGSPFDMRKTSATGSAASPRRKSSIAHGATTPGRKASVASGISADFRKFSSFAWGGKQAKAPESTTTSTLRLPQNSWILVDRSLWFLNENTEADGDDVAQQLREETEYMGIGGLIIDSREFDGRSLRRVCNQCLYAGLDVMLLEDSDTPTTAPVYPLVAGVVFRNAAILTNGERRDFFQATKLRTALARCKMQQKTREEFFVGFLDLWHTKPLPAVVRRANKMAKFHKATLHQASSDSLQNSITLPVADCLSAFDLLRSQDIVKAQENWLSSALANVQTTPGILRPGNFEVLSSDHRLASLVYPFRTHGRKDSGISVPASEYDREPPPPYISNAPPRDDFWTHSSQNKPMCSQGCYDLREELFIEQYETVVDTQKHLKALGLLEPVEGMSLGKIIDALRLCLNTPALDDVGTPGLFQSITDLIYRIESNSVVLFRGLDSGFRLPDNQGHFWAVSADITRTVNIFVSLKAPDVPMVVLHTFLAHIGVPRQERLLLEFKVSRHQTGVSKLPPRVTRELSSATYSELLFMLEQMKVSGVDDIFSSMIRQECERLLIEEPTRIAFISLQCNDLLAGKATIRDIVQARLSLLAKAGAPGLPNLQKIVEAAIELDNIMQRIFYESDEARLKALSQPVLEAYSRKATTFDASLDLYALMFFTSLRKHAFEEIYLETTDRCPLFLQQHDQAAVFAEMWALGSQCEIYFGIKPRALGAIIYDRYRDYLVSNPPSTESSKIAEVFTAYQNVAGLDNDQAIISTGPLTWQQRFALWKAHFASATFLTVFCVPAIIDVLLLTFLGRGLYLTAFMSRYERLMANYAVLSALIMTAGITGWTGSSGGFYLHTAAFHNMNHFMVQRVSGGFIIALIFALCGFVAFGLEYSWYAGFVFAAYLVVLSTYLNILGVLTTMHRNNSPFTSGRTVLLSCMLITLISPILSTFVNGHDVLIYLIVLYVFLGVQIYFWQKLARKWVTWMTNIHLTSEKEIMSWYRSQHSTDETENLPKHLQRSEASMQLMDAIKGHDLKQKVVHSDDSFISKLARGHKYTVFMLRQDDPMSELPEPYGPTWITRMKLALENQRALSHGLKEHSSFLLFRFAKYDIAQNVGFFLVVLMDRWVSVSMSANGEVINLYYDVRSRYGIAFGLIYFLICAVSLDIVLQRYWGKTGRTSTSKLASLSEFNLAEELDSRLGKKRWLTAAYELVAIMIGVFGLTTILVWLFCYQTKQIILYLLYILGYSGALLFQFNRVFTTNIKYHCQAVFASSFVGYIVGIILHTLPLTQEWLYIDVAAMITASLLSAFTTWLITDFTADAKTSGDSGLEDTINWKTYSQKLIGSTEAACSPPVSFSSSGLGTELRHDDGTSLSRGIHTRFAKAIDQLSNPVVEAFEDYRELLEQTLSLWGDGSIRLFLVPRKEFIGIAGSERFAFSKLDGGVLNIIVGMPQWGPTAKSEELSAQVIAEALLHESCEGAMQMRHAHATLAELLLNEGEPISTRMAVQLAESSPSDLSRILSKTNEELLNHLCLGVNPDITWDQMPEAVRNVILSRILGKRYAINAVVEQWLLESANSLLLRQLSLQQCLAIKSLALWKLNNTSSIRSEPPPMKFPQVAWQEILPEEDSSRRGNLAKFTMAVYVFFFQLIQFVAIITTAGADAGRELWVSLSYNKSRYYVLWLLLKFWKLCSYMKEAWMYVIVFSQDSEYKQFTNWSRYGGFRILKKGRLMIDDPVKPETCFISYAAGKMQMHHYNGFHTSKPDSDAPVITTYDEESRLLHAVHIRTPANGTQEAQKEEWFYHFDSERKSVPVFKSRLHGEKELREYYDENGRIIGGQCMRHDEVVDFLYIYNPKPKNSDQIIRATYTFAGSQPRTTWEVYWCDSEETDHEGAVVWVPCQRVTCLSKTRGESTREVTWKYDHKRDPIKTKNPPSLSLSYQEDESDMIELEAKRLGFLEKPTATTYFRENILDGHSHRSIIRAAQNEEDEDGAPVPEVSKLPLLARFRSRGEKNISVVHYPLPTYFLRTALWKYWLSHPEFGAVVACKLDEMMLRREPSLELYWSHRDSGKFLMAKEYLAEHLNRIIAAIELADDVSQRVNLAIRLGDLFEMGLSKDSNYVINNPEESYIDTDSRLAVIFTDTGCWPDAPGGVSNCRRDLVDGHKTIRNYAVTEGAYDCAVPRFQVERNVQLVQNIPLWGLDNKTPVHGLFHNLLQSEVDQRARVTSSRNIKEIFIPILKRIIRAARTRYNTNQDLRELTLCFLRLNEYFETNDYTTTWRSNAVKRVWRETWLQEYNDPNIQSFSTLFPMEQPTRHDFEEALELYIGYFFIFSIRIPEKVPRVYQSTHHGISSLWGMCLKLRRGTVWGIWDHAILWRESCLNISTAQCFLPIPVQNMLLAGMKVAAHLAYMHADVILPCTDTFNPSWEIEVGTDQGCLASKALMERKIDPITNGIANMSSFTPVDRIRTEEPTCVMLSNVQFIKDVKNAIQAAGVIVNDFGFKTYNLVVYGAQDRQPSYAVETEELIASLGIGGTVRLGGFGSPKDVLKDAWLFMNSSLSEGLPLAIGEAALAGVPIVATEVGATAQVLTDVDDPSIRYGEVVSPNDPVALARAQISLLAMLGPWAKYTTDAKPPLPLPSKFTPHDVQWITARMYEKVEDRRALGMKLREVVLRKFNGGRYLREHEQMYWIQRHMATQRADTRLEQLAAAHPKFNQPLVSRYIEIGRPQWVKFQWHQFPEPVEGEDHDGEYTDNDSDGGSTPPGEQEKKHLSWFPTKRKARVMV